MFFKVTQAKTRVKWGRELFTLHWSEIIESVFYKSMTLLIIARDTSYVMHCKNTDFFLISNYELMKSLVLRKGS